jgi:hypothetical protein
MDRQARIVAGEGKDMTREDILKLARVVGLRSAVLLHIYDGREGALTDQELAELQRLERFAALVAAAEREACAQIAREFDRDHPNTNYGGYIARLIEETAP